MSLTVAYVRAAHDRLVGFPRPAPVRPATEAPAASGAASAGAAVVPSAAPKQLRAPHVPTPPAPRDRSDPPTAEAIRRRLESAGRLDRDRVARAIVNGLSAGERRALSLAAENELVDALTSGIVSRSDEAAVRSLYAAPTVDPAFERWAEGEIQRLGGALLADPRTAEGLRRWPSLRREQRLALLQRVADGFANHFGLRPHRLRTFDGGRGLGGYTQGGRVYIDASEAALGHLGLSLDNVLHEWAHLYQRALADQYQRGAIAVTDPRHGMARAFALNDRHYVSSNDDDDVYATQPEEHHATKWARQIGDALRRGLGAS